MGSGRTELMQCLYGSYEGKSTISIHYQGKYQAIDSSQKALELGIAMVPEDRKRHGIIPIMSVGQNISLSGLDAFSSLGVLDAPKRIAIYRVFN